MALGWGLSLVPSIHSWGGKNVESFMIANLHVIGIISMESAKWGICVPDSKWVRETTKTMMIPLKLAIKDLSLPLPNGF